MKEKDQADRKGSADGRGRGSRKPADPPQPRDVVDGIPDRSSRRPAWKYIVLAAIFLGWLALLIYFAAAN